MKKLLGKLVWVVIAVPGIILAILWDRLPEKIALHFDLKGNPDRFGDKSELLTMVIALTGMNILVYLILTNVYRIDPKKHAAANKDRLRRIAFAVVMLVSFVLSLIIYAGFEGNIKFKTGLIFSAVGLMFALIGNYMPNLKPNYFAGLRLPWTLENEDNWRKTHHLAGKLWFAGGLLLVPICLLIPPIPSIIVFFTVTMIIVIIPAVYSYKLYKKQTLH